jgi:hypothetical protein
MCAENLPTHFVVMRVDQMDYTSVTRSTGKPIKLRRNLEAKSFDIVMIIMYDRALRCRLINLADSTLWHKTWVVAVNYDIAKEQDIKIFMFKNVPNDI